jgi:hypothetical protein
MGHAIRFSRPNAQLPLVSNDISRLSEWSRRKRAGNLYELPHQKAHSHSHFSDTIQSIQGIETEALGLANSIKLNIDLSLVAAPIDSNGSMVNSA